MGKLIFIQKMEIDNTPIYNCRGCESTAGRLGCYDHSPQIKFKSSSIRCKKGHVTNSGYKYCQDCGEKL